MKISIGSIRLEFRVSKVPSKREKVSEQNEQSLCASSSTDNTQEHVDTPPMRKIFKEAAHQNLMRCCMRKPPTLLPDPKTIPLASMVTSIASFGKSLSTQSEDGREVLKLEPPFVDYLLNRKVLSFTQALAERVEIKFLETETHWKKRCKLIEDLAYGLMGLYYLKCSAIPFQRNITEAANSQRASIQEAATLLNATLDSISNLHSPEAPDLSYAYLLRYTLFAKSRFQTLKEITRIDKSEEGLPHALTIDPQGRRFFIHLKKKSLQGTVIRKKGKGNVHEALMVSGSNIVRVEDYSLKSAFIPPKTFTLERNLTEGSYVEDPPLAKVVYRKKKSGLEESIEKAAFFSMPFCGNLSYYQSFIPDGPDVEKIIKFLFEASCGLDTLHKAGYLHGNISPSAIALKKENLDDEAEVMTAVISHLDSVRSIHDDEAAFGVGYLGNALYSPPEAMREPLTQKADIWSFGITAWQCLYGDSPEAHPFSNLTELTECSASQALRAVIPQPKTLQEVSLQSVIRRCLSFSPKFRISSQELTQLLESVKNTPPVAYTPVIERRLSLQDIFKPFEHFEKRMGQRPGSPMVRSVRRCRSYVRLPGSSSLGNRSLPPELFNILSEGGKLHEYIDEVEALLRKSFLQKAVPLRDITDTDEGLKKTYRVLEELEGLIDKFKPKHAMILESQSDNLIESRKKLEKYTNWIQSTPIEGAAGLTYGQYQFYQSFRKKMLKRYKKPAAYLGEGDKVRPIAHHFARNLEEGLDYPVSWDPNFKRLYIHMKKKGTRGKELGKGAEKSVHEATMLEGNTIDRAADVVIRLDTYDHAEEELKLEFADCMYIEDPATALTVYDKEEIPGFWKTKKDLSPIQIEEVAKTREKVPVKKIGFLAPLYFCSLGGLSYQLEDKRDIPLILKLLADTSKGVAHLHKKGYLHRDLKPGNILVKKTVVGGQDHYIGVVADLGEAVYVGPQGILPAGIMMAGTKHYNSPETCYAKNDSGYQRQSFASDIWAFGVMSLQALYGMNGRDIPFLDSNSKTHIFAQLQNLTQEMLDECLDARFPTHVGQQEKDVQLIIRSCLRVNPNDRPSADALAASFDCAMGLDAENDYDK